MISLKNVIKLTTLQRVMPFYAVAKGSKIGIFDSWDKCSEQVKGYKGAVYKKFKTCEEAEKFINEKNTVSNSSNEAKPAKFPKFAPKDFALPLGTKGAVKWQEKPTISTGSTQLTIVDQAAKEVNEFWPDCDGDNFLEDDFTDAELLFAAAAAEVASMDLSKGGIGTGLSTRKRKYSELSNNNSRLYSTTSKHISKIWEPVGIVTHGGYEFHVDEEDFVIVYTDGSCFNNGRANACAGYGVYFGDEHPLNAAEPVTGRVTNNVGEIQAAIHAIKVAKDVGISKLCISTDSQFLINSVTSWMTAWKRKGWRLKSGGPVKNYADFIELDKLLENEDDDDEDFQVKWNYVKAHDGIRGNEMADKLARKGSELYAENKSSE